MRAITTFAPLQQILSPFLNQFQLEAAGVRLADTAQGLTSGTDGADIIFTQTNAEVTTGNLLVIDASQDWRDRMVMAWGWLLTTDQRIGQADDYMMNNPALGIRQVMQLGYTGTGGISNLGTGAAVSAGNPPLNGAGANRSYAPVLYRTPTGPSAYDNLYLYADGTSNGELCLYNESGTNVYFTGLVWACGQTGERS